MSVDLENGLDAFLLEAQALAPPTAAPTATAPKGTVVPLSSVRTAVSHEPPAATIDSRLFNHVSKEAADTRRRLMDLRRVIDETGARHAADLDRLNRAVYAVLFLIAALGVAQLAFAIWTSLK